MTDELTGPSAASGYPARLAIDYPDDGLNRLTTAFRLFMLIPIVLVATLLTGNPAHWRQDEAVEGARIVISPGGFLIPHYIVLLLLGVVTLVLLSFAWFAILVTGRYPRGIFCRAPNPYPLDDADDAHAMPLDAPEALADWM